MKIKSNPKAFTLVEVIMALFILTMGLLGIMQLAASNLTTTLDSRDEIVAASLAQDGLELIYNVKDNNKANKASGVATFQYFPPASSTICRIDRTYNYLTSAGTLICPAAASSYELKYGTFTGFVHAGFGAVDTKFYRRIKITTDADSNKVVTAYVTWNAKAPTDAMVAATDCKTTCNIGASSKCACAQMTLTDN